MLLHSFLACPDSYTGFWPTHVFPVFVLQFPIFIPSEYITSFYFLFIVCWFGVLRILSYARSQSSEWLMRYERVETVEKLCNLRVKSGQKGQTGQTHNVGFFFLWNWVSNFYCNSKAVFWRLQRQGRPFVAWIHKRKKLLIPWRFWSHGREKDNKLDHFLVKNDQVERGKFRS